MKKHCESAKRFGTEGNGWHRDEIVTRAREFLEVGGSKARRELVRTTLELVRTTLELDRLLNEVRS